MSNVSTVNKLLEQIQALPVAIEEQKRVLFDLEQRRSNARMTLNSYLDPMARLPLEIQSQIFFDVEPGTASKVPHSLAAPMVFLTISRLWHAIALAIPRLWTTLEIEALPRRAGYIELCNRWIQRTQSLPLLLSLEGARGSLLLDPNTQDLVTRHRDRLESLNLGLSVTRWDNLYPERRILVRGPFPALRTLRVHANEGISFSKVDEWLDLLIAAPALTTCTFDNMSCTPAHRLVHPALRYLCFGEAYSFSSRLNHGNTATLLKYVTLPALQTLRITNLDIKESEFISFLTRSSPPLRSLSLVFNQRWPPQFMSAIFKSMPTLTRSELVRASWSDPNFMLTLLTAAQDGALPLLHTLRVVMHAKIDYLRLSSILRTRRTTQQTPLAVFQLCFPSKDVEIAKESLNEEALAAFRQLAQDGLDIHIGPKGQNLVL
ncbi:hypothetical protein R3P38DRAFT_2590423 [Favolaschia claudopus]|uniref:F-box domain-containing protein n=2 Tax=Favolaschia claudopus TaxID=2862362 RepID=A0AAV9Z0B4_9AGAR